jgi:hypothetical protein
MSCGLALATALLLTNPDVALAASVDPATVPADLTGLAAEPLFIDIVSRSERLKGVAEGWAATGTIHTPGFLSGSEWLNFRTEATALGELNMQGHLILTSRESEGDMACILRGLSADLPVRLADMEAADTAGARDLALAELVHLFDDNVAVITSPAQTFPE